MGERGGGLKTWYQHTKKNREYQTDQVRCQQKDEEAGLVWTSVTTEGDRRLQVENYMEEFY